MFKITCGACGKHIRDIEEWKFHNHDEKVKYGQLAFPFGKYKGLFILSMVEEEQVKYLRWVMDEKGIWNKMYPQYQEAIRFHLNHLPGNSEKPFVDEDKSVKKFDPLTIFEKNFDPDDLPM